MKPFVMLVEEIYEDLELWYPKIRLEEAGYRLLIAGPESKKSYKGKHGYPCKSDCSISELKASELSGILIPGGFAPDKLRRDPHVLKLTYELFAAGKLVAFICHGGWVAISAKILKGKRATGTIAIKDDLENAGALWVDAPVVVDNNLISSRTPLDLPHFLKEILKFIAAN